MEQLPIVIDVEASGLYGYSYPISLAWASGLEAVLYSDVPEQVRRNFKEHQFGAACPVADDGRDYAYYVDYEVWLVRLLRAALAAKIGSHRQ